MPGTKKKGGRGLRTSSRLASLAERPNFMCEFEFACVECACTVEYDTDSAVSGGRPISAIFCFCSFSPTQLSAER